VAVSRKAKVPTAGPKIVYKRSYKIFCCDSYVVDVKSICWSDVINEEYTDSALDEFMKLLLPNIDKHAPVKKLTVRTIKAPWIDEALKNCLVERDGAEGVANKSGCTSDWLSYSKLRNNVAKVNKKKYKPYYEAKINDIKNGWKKTLEYIK
jgi:hypothetical protein